MNRIDCTLQPTRRLVSGALASTGLAGLFVTRDAAAQATNQTPLSAFARLPAVRCTALSPDGRRVAFISETDGKPVLCSYDVESEAIVSIRLGESPPTHVMWADNANVVVVTTSTRRIGTEDYSVSFAGAVNIDTRKYKEFFRSDGTLYPSVQGEMSRIQVDGHARIATSHYSIGDDMSRISFSTGLFGISIDSGRAFELDIDGFPIIDWAIRADGTVVGRCEYNESTREWTVRYKGPDGWHKIFAVREVIDYPYLYGLGRDGVSLLIRFNAGERAGQFCEMRPDGTLSEPFALSGYDHYPLFDYKTLNLAGFGNSRSVDTWTFFDPRMKNLANLISKALPGSRNTICDYGEDPRHVVVLSEAGDDGGTYFYFNFLTGTYKSIGAAYPELAPADVHPKQAFNYKASDGLDIEGFVTLPSDGGKHPAVVLPHGGLAAFNDAGFDWLAQAFVSRGYAVIQPNYRGSGGRGIGFETKGYGELAGKAGDDLTDAVKHLAAQGMIDPAKTAIVGVGIGGYLAQCGVTLRMDGYRCAVSIGGIGDLKTYFKRQRQDYDFKDDASGLLYIKRFLGPEGEWVKNSPISHVQAAGAPLLLVHGDDDTSSLPTQSTAMAAAMKAAGKPVDLLILKGEDHYLARDATRLQALEATVGFVLKHNPPT